MFLRRGTHDSVKKQNENFKVRGSSHSYSDSSVQNTNFSSFINKKGKKLHYLYFVEKAVVPIKRRCKKRKFVNRFSRWRLLWFRSSANSYKRLTLPYLEKEIGGKSKAWVTTPANCSIDKILLSIFYKIDKKHELRKGQTTETKASRYESASSNQEASKAARHDRTACRNYLDRPDQENMEDWKVDRLGWIRSSVSRY